MFNILYEKDAINIRIAKSKFHTYKYHLQYLHFYMDHGVQALKCYNCIFIC